MLRPVNLATDLKPLLSLFYGVASYFNNDLLPNADKNLLHWAKYISELIESTVEWFYVRENRAGNITGAVWGENWTYYDKTPFACELSGFSMRGMTVNDNLQNLKEFTALLFTHSPVYIIRAVVDKDNIAARRALCRAGFSIIETQRAAYIKNNVEHTAIIISMTRPEFELFQQKDRERYGKKD